MSSLRDRVRTFCVVLGFVMAWPAAAEDAPAPATPPAAPESAAPPESPTATVAPAPAEAPKTLPAWMQPDVVKSAIDIGMNEQQQTEFRRLVGKYITDRVAMVIKVLDRGGANQDMTIKSKDRNLIADLDKEMKSVLTPEQWPKYEAYKKVLKSKLKG